jgi:predicted acylesterase/phospholipase RssA
VNSPYLAPLATNPTLIKAAPIAITGRADRDWDGYRAYIDHSCDLTMRGGTTSGVVYPLAVCELAKQYVFRSVGGASAGAIAASATAAAELGRTATPPKERGPQEVDPGFAGLEQIITWLSGSGDEWRLAQLFQPGKATHRLFRVAAASMQGSTGKSKLRCLSFALLAMLGPVALLAVVLSTLVWLVVPSMIAWLPPSRWASWPAWTSWLCVLLAVVSAAGIGTAIGHGRNTAKDLGRETKATPPTAIAGGVAAVPLVGAMVVFLIHTLMHGGAQFPHIAWWATVAAVVVAWLGLTLAAAGVFSLVLSLGGSRFLAEHARDVHFGLVPGTTAEKRGRVGRFVDRLAGMPERTGVPGLSVWLADRIDDLAGVPATGPNRHALTFGDLWQGRLEHNGEDWARFATDRKYRVINLELMTTNLSQGRPYRLPFLDAPAAAKIGGTTWLFCGTCLTEVLPDRVVKQLTAAAPPHLDQHGTCHWHTGTPLRPLPAPWHIPVVMAARMSLSLPGLIAAVPLYSAGADKPVPQWFSDGGITSNFPIHFFDSLLPRWPTFGLNLQPFPTPDADAVYLPAQDTSTSTEQWVPIDSAFAFVNSILDTFLGWRDTMQSALPGFRGRIAQVRQHPSEGGSNLFMRPETIKELAERGRCAGAELRDQFRSEDGDAKVTGQTQTDRYRWIRMRLAMRKYGELAREIDDGAPLYRELAKYVVPSEVGGWFTDPALEGPAPDPGGPLVAEAIDALAGLAANGQPLATVIPGAPPTNPDLRLTPRE